MIDKDKIPQLNALLREAKRANDKLHETIGEFVGLSLYRLYEERKDVTWKDLAKLKDGEIIVLPVDGLGNVVCTKIRVDGNNLYYEAVFSSQAVLTRHHHSDCIEIVEVVSGNFTVALGDEKKGTFRKTFITEGEKLVVPPDTEHHFMNKSKQESKLKITFKLWTKND